MLFFYLSMTTSVHTRKSSVCYVTNNVCSRIMYVVERNVCSRTRKSDGGLSDQECGLPHRMHEMFHPVRRRNGECTPRTFNWTSIGHQPSTYRKASGEALQPGGSLYKRPLHHGNREDPQGRC